MDAAKQPHQLVGCTVGWQGTGGTQHQGVVTVLRHIGDRAVFQIAIGEDRHVWMMADFIEETGREAFYVIKHGPRSMEYGLELADAILQGKGTHLPINHQMITLAATVVALHDELNHLSDASQDAPASQPQTLGS